MKRLFFTLLGLVLCVSVAGGSLIFAQNKDAVSEQSQLANNALFTKNRDHVIVCVDDYSSSSDSAELQNLIKRTSKVIENSVKTHKDWNRIGASKYEIEVKAGCSLTPFLVDEENSHPIYSGKNQIRGVNLASQEQIAIFVVDNNVIERHFNGAPTRWSPEEYLCEENECMEVTSGIYISTDEAYNLSDAKLIKELKHRFGLDREHKKVTADEEAEKLRNSQQSTNR